MCPMCPIQDIWNWKQPANYCSLCDNWWNDSIHRCLLFSHKWNVHCCWHQTICAVCVCFIQNNVSSVLATCYWLYHTIDSRPRSMFVSRDVVGNSSAVEVDRVDHCGLVVTWNQPCLFCRLVYVEMCHSCVASLGLWSRRWLSLFSLSKDGPVLLSVLLWRWGMWVFLYL